MLIFVGRGKNLREEEGAETFRHLCEKLTIHWHLQCQTPMGTDDTFGTREPGLMPPIHQNVAWFTLDPVVDTEAVFTLGDTRSFFGLASKIPPLGSMLNFDVDVKKTTGRHQCEHCLSHCGPTVKTYARLARCERGQGLVV